MFHQKLCDFIEEASGGKFILNLHPCNEIVPTYEQTEAVRDGVLDMGHSDLGAEMGLVGKSALLLGASGYPAGTTCDEDSAWYYLGDGMDYARKVFADYGLVIGLLTEGQEVFGYAHKPLETAADLDGLKFRTIGLWAEVLGTFGASVVTIPGGEVYQAAEKGVIDGFEYAGPAVNWPMGFHEIMEYMMLPGIHSPAASHTIKVNRESWAKLPSDLQHLLTVAIEAHSYEFRNELLLSDSAAIQKYRDYGTTIVYVGDELQAEIAKRTKEITEGYAADDPLFKEMWENKQAFVKTFKAGKNATTLKYSIYD
jgi:TRAP-type mannitol/chloroaromatic compound transport system substrate-binding protein